MTSSRRPFAPLPVVLLTLVALGATVAIATYLVGSTSVTQSPGDALRSSSNDAVRAALATPGSTDAVTVAGRMVTALDALGRPSMVVDDKAKPVARGQSSDAVAPAAAAVTAAIGGADVRVPAPPAGNQTRLTVIVPFKIGDRQLALAATGPGSVDDRAAVNGPGVAVAILAGLGAGLVAVVAGMFIRRPQGRPALMGASGSRDPARAGQPAPPAPGPARWQTPGAPTAASTGAWQTAGSVSAPQLAAVPPEAATAPHAPWQPAGPAPVPRVAFSAPAMTATNPQVVRPVAAAERERDALAAACIRVADQLTSPSLIAELDQGLRGAGFEPVSPLGEPFDPSAHHAVESTPSADPATLGRVAAVQRPGWRGHGRTLRPADVAVYQSGDPTH